MNRINNKTKMASVQPQRRPLRTFNLDLNHSEGGFAFAPLSLKREPLSQGCGA